MAKPSEISLADCPTDSVSCVSWLSQNDLAVASWDSSVRLYGIDKAILKSAYSHKASVLAVASADGKRTFSGGLDMAVRVHDWESSIDTVLGSHTAAVRAMTYVPEHRCVITASWDKTMQVWDERLASSGSSSIAMVSLPEKAYSLSSSAAAVSPHLLVAATAARHVGLYDLRKLTSSSTASSALLFQRESSLKHQTRCVAAFLDGTGWATGSTEGRVAVDFVDEAPSVQERKYAFKCHRRKLPAPAGAATTAEEEVFPVDCLAVHPVYGTLATGGGDATVAVWDWVAKKRLAAYAGYPQAITAMAFSPDGTSLALASSYDWSRGEQAPVPSRLFVRQCPDVEVRPKGAGGAVK